MSHDTMTLWADVLVNDTIVGTGPIPLISASVTRLIDGSGQFKLDAPLDVKGRETLRAGRQVKIWLDLYGSTRLMGEGYITKVGINGERLAISGNDLMEALKWDNTLLGYQINGETVQQAISDLVAANGWTVLADETAAESTVTLPFDGETSLKALLSVAEAAGVHVRVSAVETRILDVGVFGEDSGITLFDPNAGAGGDRWSGIIEGYPSIEEQADQIATRILPEGGAFEQDPNVTLEDSTRSGVSTTTGQSGTIYYVRDAEAESVYGIRWEYKTFPDIKPLSSSAGDTITAANQLYDAAYAYLQTVKDIRRNYKMKIRGLTVPLAPGDLVKVLYTGLIYQDDGSIWPEGAINEDLYINRVEEYAGEGGTWQNVDLSNVNSQKVDEATDVAIAVERSKKV
jgi:hypothetical protein